MTKATYRHDYKVNRMARDLIIKAVKDSKVNVHKDYNLFEVTSSLESICVQYRLERYGIGTTLEVMRAIEYLKDTNKL